MPTLIDNIRNLIDSRFNPHAKQAIILERVYTCGSREQKESLDRAFLALCGRSLESLIVERNSNVQFYNTGGNEAARLNGERKPLC